MRWIFASTTVTLLSAWLFCPAPPTPTDRGIPCPANRQGSAMCRDGGSTDHGAPAGVEDQLLKRTLKREAERLLTRGQTVEMGVLIRQLHHSVCALDLQAPESAVYDPVDLYSAARRSVVLVSGLYKCGHCSDWHVSTASGFVLTADGAVVTNYHVVDSPEYRTLVVMTADQHVVPVQRVLAANRADDLAILKIEARGLHPLPLVGPLADSPVGTPVSVISHPDGRYYHYSEGVVTRHLQLDGPGRTVEALTISAEYARGSSGAPVLNRQGQVIAVVSNTESIYYTQDGPRQRDLQMVIRTCAPAASILRLIHPPAQLTNAESKRALIE
jgi:serine protease Do